MQVFNKDLKVIEDEYVSTYANLPKEVRKNLWRNSTERLVYKAGDYISKAISDKAKILKSQLNNLQSSYDKIAADLETERTRKANDIRDIEK
jgi:molecular chaperone GrpE (heat shock protein)